MNSFDVFNGDADGLCALVQLRLGHPRPSVRVTGVKRAIALLDRVEATRDDRVTVLDVSLDRNRAGLERLLAAGAWIEYFDHHHAGAVPAHDHLDAHVDTAPDVCTSLLVDRHLSGAQRLWAIVGAFGDNLPEPAARLASACALSAAETAALRRLGEALNYNAYGESIADLRFDPHRLAEWLLDSRDPFAFIGSGDHARVLSEGLADDLALARTVAPIAQSARSSAYLLPDAGWARRVSGVFANQLALADPQRAHAILSVRARGHGYTVSVRAPKARPLGADALCRRFESGGGRSAAAGINHLPEDALDAFLGAFRAHFAAEGGAKD